jgi:hypothetical protein
MFGRSMKHWLLVATLAHAGCAHYVARPIDPARNGTKLSSRRLLSRTWTLTALAEEAARTAPEVAVARAQYAAAKAAVRTAGERPNPTVALSPQIVTPYTGLIPGT